MCSSGFHSSGMIYSAGW